LIYNGSYENKGGKRRMKLFQGAKVMSVILTLAMIVGMLPAAAFAETASDDATVRLAADYSKQARFFYVYYDGTESGAKNATFTELTSSTPFSRSPFVTSSTPGYFVCFVVPQGNNVLTAISHNINDNGVFVPINDYEKKIDYPYISTIVSRAKEDSTVTAAGTPVAIFQYSRTTNNVNGFDVTISITTQTGGINVTATSDKANASVVHAGDNITFTINVDAVDVGSGLTAGTPEVTSVTFGDDSTDYVKNLSVSNGTYTLKYTVTEDDAKKGTVTLNVKGKVPYTGQVYSSSTITMKGETSVECPITNQFTVKAEGDSGVSGIKINNIEVNSETKSVVVDKGSSATVSWDIDSNKYELEKVTVNDKYVTEKANGNVLVISDIQQAQDVKITTKGKEIGYTVNYYYDGVMNKTENNTDARYGAVVTVNPAETIEGYKLEKVVYPNNADSLTVSESKENNVIDVYYVKDKIGGKDTDGNDIGDGIPDKYQVVINYQSSNTGYGKVNMTTEVITLKNADGNYAESGDVIASATATPVSSRDSLKNWTMKGVTAAVSTDKTLNYTISDAKGGETYKFTANFTHTYSGGGGSSSKPITEITDPDVPLGGDVNLNKEDHFAYVKGYPDGNVKPEGNITRAEVATIFYRLLDDTSRIMYFASDNDFTDVADSFWANKAISTLSNAGIIDGYTDGTFQPNKAITRAEFAAIAARFDSVTEDVENPFTDTAGHWGEKLISFAASKGWVNGYEDNTFKPNKNITRAEAMTLINRVLNREVDKDGLLDNAAYWPDNQEGKWYYFDVLEATNTHDYDRRSSDSIMENWTELLADPVWNEM
jgi:hypothetical protein